MLDSRPGFRLALAGDAHLTLDRRTAVMGIVNVTPDSFSDGGLHATTGAAIEAGLRMADEGAALIDVGGESTRPGAAAVDAETECRRVVPVIEALARRLPAGVHLSVDTMKAEVAERALDAGAALINDVAGGRDAAMLPLVARRRAAIVLMHMRGTPRTMQRDTDYPVGLLETLADELGRRAAAAVESGVAGDRIVLDPGIGFGKSAEGNLEILRRVERLAVLGRPLLVGASRKSFLGAVTGLPVERRLEAGLAAAVLAASGGAHIVRTHDVGPTVRALRVVDAVRGI